MWVVCLGSGLAGVGLILNIFLFPGNKCHKPGYRLRKYKVEKDKTGEVTGAGAQAGTGAAGEGADAGAGVGAGRVAGAGAGAGAGVMPRIQ